MDDESACAGSWGNEWLRARVLGDVVLFAYIDPVPRYSLRNGRPAFFKATGDGFRATATEAAIRRAVRSFGVEHEVAIHEDPSVYPASRAAAAARGPPSVDPYSDYYREQSNATRVSAGAAAGPARRGARLRALEDAMVQQSAKLSAAVAMMVRHEQRRARRFDVVIRIRPDACLNVGRPFFDFVLRRAHCASVVQFTVGDVATVAPRSLANAIG